MTCRRIIRRTRALWGRRSRAAGALPAAGLTLLVLCLVVTAGCESSNSTSMNNGSGGSAASGNTNSNGGDDARNPGIDPEVITRLEEEFPFGPQAARTIDYRIDWKSDRGGAGVKMMRVQGDSVFVLDRFNVLTRLDRDSGDVIWRTAVEQEFTEIIGVNFIPAFNRVYVATGGSLLVFEGETGSMLDRQRLDKVINVQAATATPFLIYGSRDGDLVWHRVDIGHQWKGYKLGQSIQVPPLIYENLVVAVGNGGELFVLDLAAALQLWSRQLDDPVDAQPEVGAGVVYVAGRDQFLRAFDLRNGRQYWHFITPSRLTSSPTLIGDRVYQHVPDVGVIAFEALPIDRIGGVEIWRVEGAEGRVITRYEEKLLTWEEDLRSMSVIDDNAGSLITTIPLPDVKFLISTGRERGVLYAASEDGRIMQLSPAH